LLTPGLGAGELLQHPQNSGSLLSGVVMSSLIDAAAVPEFESPTVSLITKPYQVPTLLDVVGEGVAKSLRRRGERRGGR
jgi:hypothetical protein